MYEMHLKGGSSSSGNNYNGQQQQQQEQQQQFNDNNRSQYENFDQGAGGGPAGATSSSSSNVKKKKKKKSASFAEDMNHGTFYATMNEEENYDNNDSNANNFGYTKFGGGGNEEDEGANAGSDHTRSPREEEQMNFGTSASARANTRNNNFDKTSEQNDQSFSFFPKTVSGDYMFGDNGQESSPPATSSRKKSSSSRTPLDQGGAGSASTSSRRESTTRAAASSSSSTVRPPGASSSSSRGLQPPTAGAQMNYASASRGGPHVGPAGMSQPPLLSPQRQMNNFMPGSYSGPPPQHPAYGGAMMPPGSMPYGSNMGVAGAQPMPMQMPPASMQQPYPPYNYQGGGPMPSSPNLMQPQQGGGCNNTMGNYMNPPNFNAYNSPPPAPYNPAAVPLQPGTMAPQPHQQPTVLNPQMVQQIQQNQQQREFLDQLNLKIGGKEKKGRNSADLEAELELPNVDLAQLAASKLLCGL